MKRIKDKHSFWIRLAIIITVLILAPGALTIGVVLKNDIDKRVDQRNVCITTEIRD